MFITRNDNDKSHISVALKIKSFSFKNPAEIASDILY